MKFFRRFISKEAGNVTVFVFSKAKDKQIDDWQCLFIDFLVALHDTFAKAFRIEAWQQTDFTNIHNIIL